MFYSKIKFLFISSFILAIFLLPEHTSLAQKSSDAISIRLIPNPQHYSSMRWYNEQGFTGSPQQLIVDGYEAIRNGNTVYVNAANVFSSVLYTNIHIISYNLEADKETEDIFSRILKNWKFNSNLNSISGHCSPDLSSRVCVTNDDCQIGTYCSSDKAATIRDTTRLANIAEFNIALDRYMKKNGHYPTLSAGTYLPNKTVSTWPSWQGTLSKELGIQLPVDPINDLGDCDNFDNITCWNETTKEFADADIADPALNLPSSSRAFIYQAEPDGSEFNICSEMESGFVSPGSGSCADGVAVVPTVVNPTPVTPNQIITNIVNTVNHPPQIVSPLVMPTGKAGNQYAVFIQAVDSDNDSITWTIDTGLPAQWTGWSTPLTLNNPTGPPNRRELGPVMAGDVGNYTFTITLSDGIDTTVESFSIRIDNFPPVINATPMTHIASRTLSFFDSFTVSGDIANYSSFSSDINNSFPLDLSTSFIENGDVFDFTIYGTLLPSTTNIMNDGVTPLVRNLIVSDPYSQTTEQIVLNIINHKPVVQPLPVCLDRMRGIAGPVADSTTGSLPVINSLTANSGSPWTIDNIDLGIPVSIDVTVNVTDADNCSWCNVPVPCDGSTPTSFSSMGYQTGTRASCILRASNSFGEVTAEGYTSFSCSPTIWNQSIVNFEALFNNGSCPVFSGDSRLCQLPGVCDEPAIIDLGIVSFSSTPNPWVVSDMDSGGTTDIDVELHTVGNPDYCSWCGTEIDCNGITTFPDSGGPSGMMASCLLTVEDTVNSFQIEETGYTDYSCIGPNESTMTFNDLTGDGGCTILGGDGFEICNDDGTRCELDCYNSGNCSGSHTCVDNECIYPAMVDTGTGEEALNCTPPEVTQAQWYHDYGDRCGEPTGLDYWLNDEITWGTTTSTASFITAYDNYCIANVETIDRAICNDFMLCDPGDTYIANTENCKEN